MIVTTVTVSCAQLNLHHICLLIQFIIVSKALSNGKGKRKIKVKVKVKWEGAHHPYLQLDELNCEGRSSRGLVEGILKVPRAAALRPNREL